MASSETILIVEDDALIALDIEMSLHEMGFEVVSAVSVAEALPIIAGRKIAFAILDFKLQQHDTGPIADALAQKGVPFAVCSGSDMSTASRVFAGVPLIPKPFSTEVLQQTVLQALH